MTLLVDDVDGVVERAVAAGARVTMPVQDMFWGGRYGKIVDPFGHEWGINQQVKEQSHPMQPTNAKISSPASMYSSLISTLSRSQARQLSLTGHYTF